MSVARSLERRLEKLIEGFAGRMFSGRLHPSELAGKLAREADFARFDHISGPATANLFVITLNPKDVTMDLEELKETLKTELEDHMIEEGLRTAGPIEVRIDSSSEASPGTAQCHVEVLPGPGETWARLTHEGVSYDITRTRCLVGRAEEADVRIRQDDVSRQHAVIYRQHGQVWVTDLGSANGTRVDGQLVGAEPITINTGSTITLARHDFRIAID